MNEEFDPQLIQRLQRLKNAPARNPHAAARGRARFLAEAASLQARPLRSPLSFRRLAWSFALLLAFLLLFGGSIGTALAAQDALPGQPLYPLKLAIEDGRLALSADPQRQIDLLLEFNDRRIQEINQLAAQGQIPPAETAQRLEAHLRQALQIAAGMDDPAMMAALHQIRMRLEIQERTLSASQGEAGAILQQTRLMLQSRLGEIEENLSNPERFRRQMRTGQPTATPSPVSSPLSTDPAPPGDQPSQGAGTPTPDSTGEHPASGTPSGATPQKTSSFPGGPKPRGTPGGGGGKHNP